MGCGTCALFVDGNGVGCPVTDSSEFTGSDGINSGVRSRTAARIFSFMVGCDDCARATRIYIQDLRILT